MCARTYPNIIARLHSKVRIARSSGHALTRTLADGDQDTGGPGLLIWNYDSTPHSGIGGTMYMLYESDHDFVPYKYIIVRLEKLAPRQTTIQMATC